MGGRTSLVWLAALAALGLASTAGAVAAVPATAAAAPTCTSNELTTMSEAAEAVRTRVNFLAPPQDKHAARRAEQLELVERKNALRLLALLDTCGWPSAASAGPRAAAQVWALAQTATTDLNFQKRLLQHLEAAVGRSDAPARYLAITADRVALLEERPQPYGTQLRPVDACTWNYYPLDDREQVEARRKAAGLAPLEDYKRSINDMIITENCPPPLPIAPGPKPK